MLQWCLVTRCARQRPVSRLHEASLIFVPFIIGAWLSIKPPLSAWPPTVPSNCMHSRWVKKPSSIPKPSHRMTAVATTSSGTACAFVTFTPLYGCLTGEATATGKQSEVQGWGWTLDLMRRAPDAPPGVMELLLVRTIERFRSSGAQVVSLGMVALADTRLEMTPGQRQLASVVTDRLGLFES